MRLFAVVLSVLMLAACASGKPQYTPPPVEETEPAVPESEPVEMTETVAEPAAPAYVDNSFLALIVRKGIPSDNLIPRSKEQIAIYDNNGQFEFYYFRDNLLVQQKSYPAAVIEQLKAAGDYPAQIFLDLGAD